MLSNLWSWLAALPPASLLLLAIVAGLVCICALAMSGPRYRGPLEP